MKSKLLPSALIVLIAAFVFSCSKDTSNKEKSPLEKRADSLQTYLTGKHFIPVDFYSDKPIDYDQKDTEVTLQTDLRSFILEYLKDDTIIFESNGFLHVKQGKTLAPAGITVQPEYPWSVGTIKADTAVLFNYLDYEYQSQRYILDEFTDSKIKAHVSRTIGGISATLYTVFEKR